MNWKLLIEIDRVLFLILAAMVVLGMFGKIRTDGPAKDLGDGRIEFGPGWLMICFFGMLATWLPIAATGYILHHTERFFAILPICIGLMMVAFVFEFPGTIVVSRESLDQHYWLRPNKRLRWEQIIEIRSSKRNGPVTIAGANGVKIVHSPHLVDRARLLQEVRKHCASELPADFPREPTEGA